MGYTPLFDTLLNGTMYGKWPHNGIWALLLSRATREGVINEVPESLAAHIGIPVEQLMASIRYFMEPDPDSRTPDDEGRRLESLDPHKSWGWRILNHGKYREKARKSVYESERVASGQNAERLRARRAAGNSDPTRPDATRRDPLSDADADAEAKREGEFVLDGAPTSSAAAAIDRIFEHWKSVWEHPRAKLDTKRRKVISDALKLYPEDDLKHSISGYKRSKHHTGQNDRKAVYDDIELFLRDAKHIDAGIAFAKASGEDRWM